MGLLAIALVIAFSPFAVIPAVLLLLAPDPRRMASAFLIGWGSGVLVLTALAVALADAFAAWQLPEWFTWIRALVALVLLWLGIRGILSRKPKDEPGWTARLSGITQMKAVSMGALLAVANPKVIALAVAGGLTIGASAETLRAEIVQVVVFVAVASLGVALPLGVHLLAGAHAQRWLRFAETWLDQRGDQLMGVVMALIGAYLLADVLL